MTGMHVIITTDGSRQSLQAARKFKSFADPDKISDISLIAVVRPLAAVGFSDDLAPSKASKFESLDFRKAAESALASVAAEFADWGPKVHKKIRSGSPANEIIKAASQIGAGLIVVAAGGRGLSETVLMGSTAQRIQHYAPCPVLVVRPTQRKPRRKA
ncbi:nucleotide-binding universal stress UspA family protein [Nocardioides albertanoniae]|uniref:Nucleotide-binding universal stress UspA family protein n=1 Tax=Nocardioides albertanoniae TaxID=1175486 RepID=A0A543A955_9ACTN|nr:universal stress protein [Nocardioides albertanoniae]TQL69138.1 nucleotide-binding universal stress UspA family protein [Nocardioides albertanoniae]